MKKIVGNICLILVILALLQTKVAISQVSFDEAENLFYNLDLNKASNAYLYVFNDSSTNVEYRALSGQKLAYISWHFHNDIDKAGKYVLYSLESQRYEAYLYRDLINYETEAKNFAKAKEVYQQAISKITSESKINLINIAYSNMVLKETIDKIENNQEIDTLILLEASQKIEQVNKAEPGMLQPAKIQLGLALLSKDGKKAMNAWNLYFNISEGHKATGLLAKPQNELFKVLINWHRNTLDKREMETLVINLANSRFYEFAFVMNLYLSKNSKTEIAEIEDIINYYTFCRQIENRLFKYYKLIVLENDNKIKKVKKDIESEQKQLWNVLNWDDKAPRYSKERFYDELYKRFGTKIYDGVFNNKYFYIGGHTIIDKSQKVEQFSHSANVQFVVLDLRFSNNYWGWFTGYYGFAGYANDVIIARYREPAASNPIYCWNKLNNKELLSKWKEEIIKLSAQDDSLYLINSNTRLSGLYERIRLNIYSGILDSLKAAGTQKDDLRKQFISVYNEIEYKHNINHEGRHAIDFNILSKWKLINNAELEFRATLSQIYFSEYPLLDIRFEINKTAHGLANKKLLKIISDWMEQNKDKIIGFDKNRPALPQLDLITNKQLREIIESVEPFLN